MNTWIPHHIISQLKTKDGRTYKSAIKFRSEDVDNFVQLEYRIIDHLVKKLGFTRYRILGQTLILNRFYRVFDVVEVDINGDGALQFWFDISLTYGLYDCTHDLTRKLYLGY